MAGDLDNGLSLTEIHRFANGPVRVHGTLHWDILGLYREILYGLRAAGPTASIGIDSWAIDYGLIDARGALIGNPVHYRDARTNGVRERVLAEITSADMYDISGLQFLPFNTVYQLLADQLEDAETMLLIPDLLSYWLTGEIGAELTNASTTGLLDVRTQSWAYPLIDRLGLPSKLFPPLRLPGNPAEFGRDLPEQTGIGGARTDAAKQTSWTGKLWAETEQPTNWTGRPTAEHTSGAEMRGAEVGQPTGWTGRLTAEQTGWTGRLRAEVAEEIGWMGKVTAVASHDTASAVVAVPATDPDFAYISCGTWSLAGVELPAPVLTDESREAGFTNEAGIDGTVRYLRNVMGLWLLQESLRTWGNPELGPLLAAAAQARPFAAIVNPDMPIFLPPGDMPARIAAECRRTGQEAPGDLPGFVRCVLESLALGHRMAIRQAIALSGHRVNVIHLVGGGSRNTLLCQLTANACGLPVVAGPTEATALGNVLVQARAAGEIGGLPEMRALVAATQDLKHYQPQGGDWAEAEARIQG
ncbi:rhamnulokinase [Acrocarpospora macrocephala]|nr:rhamnulokinase family protein [Acrocarpospora macrocephala]